MSSSDTIFSSDFSEQRWADQISENFDNDFEVNVSDVPVSVFSVPKAISAFKPEAYMPQVVALGPYHHFRTELYEMERYKVAAVQSFLNSRQIRNFQTLLIDKLKQLAPTIRACYHKYLDFDDNTLAWIIAVDGLFFLDLFNAYSDGVAGKKMTQNSILCRDIMILENQFPAILLREIRKTLQLVVVDENDYDLELYNMLRAFCVAHSPLRLGVTSEHSPDTKINPLHLLDLMYFSILKTRVVAKAVPQESSSTKADVAVESETNNEDLILNLKDIMDVTLNLGIGGQALRPLQVINNLPWEKIYNLLGLKTDNTVDQTNTPVVEEISIPSVTFLSNVAGVDFKPTGGIQDIEFNEREATLYLPVITLNGITEVFLRNLVAYEAAIPNSSLELAQYVDLISGIIDTAEDATILIEKGIIKGELTSTEIADLFNGMNKSSGNAGNGTIDQINEYLNKMPKAKVYRFWKNKVYDSWRALTVLSTILLLLLLILQSFCDVYGCQRFFGSSN
ncbi:hypothetical protein LguiA_018739 [Lonicera macranthoides]